MSLLKAPCTKTSWRALLFHAIFGITGVLIVCFDIWRFKEANNHETGFGGHHCDFEQHMPCLTVHVCMNSITFVLERLVMETHFSTSKSGCHHRSQHSTTDDWLKSRSRAGFSPVWDSWQAPSASSVHAQHNDTHRICAWYLAECRYHCEVSVHPYGDGWQISSLELHEQGAIPCHTGTQGLPPWLSSQSESLAQVAETWFCCSWGPCGCTDNTSHWNLVNHTAHL